jgi:hypothetical protein
VGNEETGDRDRVSATLDDHLKRPDGPVPIRDLTLAAQDSMPENDKPSQALIRRALTEGLHTNSRVHGISVALGRAPQGYPFRCAPT